MVTSYGAVLAGSEHPEEAYEFLKYMLDQPYFEHYDLSVNRASAEKMVDQLTRTTYNIKQMNGYFDIPNLELETDYLMKPLTEKTKVQILDMLNNMTGATLNNWPVYYKIQSNMLEYILGEVSLEESYQNCLKELNEYVSTFTFEGQLQDGINFDY